MQIEYTSPARADAFREALDAVARERKYLLFLEGPDPERTRRFVASIVEKNETQFLALDGDRVVGWCDVTTGEMEGVRHVGSLGMGVVKTHRGKGLGARLIAAAIDDAFAKGLERIELEVFADNAAAIALYEKTGFRHEGRRRRARCVDGVYVDILVMGLLKADRP